MASAADFLPGDITLPNLVAAASRCRGCDLWRNATQTVFGAGSDHAELVLIGEQPGDREDKQGAPFVGPAGGLLDQALADAGIDRARAYVTNAVKHFKWEPRGTRRLHKKPGEREIDACTPWLLAEVSLLRPGVVVCLGATAARAAFGHTVRVGDLRGRFAPSRLAQQTFVTLHPSAILRLHGRPEWREDYARAYARFVRELGQVKAHMHGT